MQFIGLRKSIMDLEGWREAMSVMILARSWSPDIRPPKSLYFSNCGHPLYDELETVYGRAGFLAPSLLVRARGAIILPPARSNNPYFGRTTMRIGTVAILVFATTMSVQAKDAPAYEKGVLIQMESSSCGYAEKDGKTIAGEIFGTDGQHKNTKVVMCQEYVLQTERVTYRIRPKDDKHPVLLPVGETAQFRIHKDKLLLRVPEADGKEREYFVLSMTPRSDVAVASKPSARGEIR